MSPKGPYITRNSFCSKQEDARDYDDILDGQENADYDPDGSQEMAQIGRSDSGLRSVGFTQSCQVFERKNSTKSEKSEASDLKVQRGVSFAEVPAPEAKGTVGKGERDRHSVDAWNMDSVTSVGRTSRAIAPTLSQYLGLTQDGGKKFRSRFASRRAPSHASMDETNRTSLRVDRVLLEDQDQGVVGHLASHIAILRQNLDVKRRADMEHNPYRQFADVVCKSTYIQFTMALVIIAHICLGVHDTNLRAEEKDLPLWVLYVELGILAAYTSELALRVYVDGSLFIFDMWNLFDTAIVIGDLVMTLFSNFDGVSILRSFRLLRVLRVLRRFLIFREVYLMIQGVSSAFRTLIFGAFIAFAIMTSWSLLAVEILNPLVKELQAKEGLWDSCERCQRSFSSVMSANLTFFKTIVASDSWGEIMVPLMENYTEAAVLLTLIFLTIQLGVVNIIIAVIVDRVQDSRINDSNLRKTVKEEELRKSYKQLWNVFRLMDSDGSGTISISEMREAYKDNAVFKNMMNSMDFFSDNLNIVFDILDKDHSGQVTYNEFVEQLHMMKEFDSHTMLVIIRHLVEKMHTHMDRRMDDQIAIDQQIASRLSQAFNLIEREQGTAVTTELRKSVFSIFNEERTSPQAQNRGKTSKASFSSIPSDGSFDLGPAANSWTTASAKPDPQLHNGLYEKFSACMKLLEHVDAMEANMHQIISVLAAESGSNGSRARPTSERRASDVRELVPHGQVETPIFAQLDATKSKRTSRTGLEQEVLRHMVDGLSEESDLRLLKTCVLKYVSSHNSLYHLEGIAEEEAATPNCEERRVAEWI